MTTSPPICDSCLLSDGPSSGSVIILALLAPLIESSNRGSQKQNSNRDSLIAFFFFNETQDRACANVALFVNSCWGLGAPLNHFGGSVIIDGMMLKCACD